jgi:3-hydroxyacyl-[acyl-carrier-protein] dehydratase
MQQSYLENSMINFGELVESYITPTGRIEKENIQKIIPYGDDFFFLDYADSITQDSIIGYFEVKPDQPYVKSHFVHKPIMPGCLVAESFAQVGTILIRKNLGLSQPVDIFVGKIEAAKFTTIVQPGQTLEHHVHLKTFNKKLGVARLQGDTMVNGKSIANFSLILVISNS